MHDVQSTFPVGSFIQGRFVVVELLSKGAFGAVYLVRDKRNHQNHFVLKEVMHAVRKKRHGSPFDAATLSRLHHPALSHIYRVFHSDKHDRSYILMDYIKGRNLEVVQAELPEEKRLSLPQAMTLMSPIVDAVSYLHRQQPPLIHGDIKPSNIIVPKVDTPAVLVDFGGAFGGAREYGSDITATPHQSKLNYRAPEQYRRGANLRTDIYALGAIFYTLLTGTVPTAAPDRLSQLGEKESDPLLPVNQIMPSIPTTVAGTIHCAMSIDSYDRFSTVDQFWEALWLVIHVTPTGTQAPELTIALPAGENTELDDDPTEPWLPKPMITPPIEENTELDAIPAAPPIPDPVVVESEMELPTLFASPTLQTEPASVDASSDPPPPPALPGEGKPPVTAPLQGRSPVHPPKKSRLPLLLFLALILSIGLGSGLWLYMGAHHLPNAAIPTSTPQFKTTPPSKVTATSAPVSRIHYPNVARPYNGTIHDIPDNLTTKMSLTGIRQQQGNIQGYFTGLLRSSSFNGTIDTTGHIHFTVAGNGGQAAISFEGVMQSDGNLAGDFCSPSHAAQCSNYGVWSVSFENSL